MHDARHEELCLLHNAAPEDCAECRDFLGSAREAGREARSVMPAPPAGLVGRTLRRMALRAAPAPRSPLGSAGIAFAMAAAMAALYLALPGREHLAWTNGVERDMGRLTAELESLRDRVASDEGLELEAEISALRRRARDLESAVGRQS